MSAEPLTIRAFVDALAERAPPEKAAVWDPVGLQLGDPAGPCRSIGVCHEVTEAVVAAVEAAPVDLLVAYHPLLFRATQSMLAGPTPEGRALRLARIGAGLSVVHTAFDVAPGGAADALAEALELTNTVAFAPLLGPDAVKIATFVPKDAADKVLEAVAAAGAGRIGNYTHCSFRTEGFGSFYAGAGTNPAVGAAGELNLEPEVRIEFPAPRSAEDAVVAALVAAHPYEEPAYDVYDRRGDSGMVGRVGRAPPSTTLGSLAESVRTALGNPALRSAGAPSQPIDRVAVVPGSGGEFVAAARAQGADALVTGDLTHHRAREALDRGLALIDPGHAATERPGLARLLAWIGELGVETVSLLELDPDPWT